jgi:hypothetical protein
MMDPSREKTVLCGTHGTVSRAFACQHLTPDATVPAGFVEPELDPDDPEPFAWCFACQQMYEHEDAWSPALAEFVNMKLVCEFCYDTIRKVHSVTR